ncbi:MULTISPECIES: 2-hydroxyacid dehydrogenase [Alkalimonas]|uniref:Glyoxylate/hydroxypyruvate reductase A n=1 Tax=Alkalimonas mucilaginosa TaxID=3057676 RepID=A0ABU7JG58_9GAMM|nr:glyoxylate/hydroxypyruvate reductase A [Alkalimonas sp. MEB004]MEE2024676.1 glyoxylate/hydroxypyruvate reductase A [Alkalimonas sp. MEB004]
MSIALVIPDRDLSRLVAALQQHLPEVVIEQWPNINQPEQVEFAVVWKQPAGSLQQFPALKAIQSYGAGVDSILRDPHLPALPLSRIVDPKLAMAMIRYLDAVLRSYQLRLDQFARQQQLAQWRPRGPRPINHICVLGLGELGQAVAAHFVDEGFSVTGWSRSLKQLAGVQCFAGTDGFPAAVAAADLVICLLPLTSLTEALLNEQQFALFKKGAILINVARGAIVDDRALLAALDSEQLQAACLDVFSQEPLPAAHPFWSHPKVTVTPHISAVTNIDTAVNQIVENYRRSQAGTPLLHQVDSDKEY